jgi:hypothetical protein
MKGVLFLREREMKGVLGELGSTSRNDGLSSDSLCMHTCMAIREARLSNIIIHS